MPSPRSGRSSGWPPPGTTRASATRKSSIAKYFAGEVANRAAQATAEMLGGDAFTDELPIRMYLNYAKLWQTGEGSANIQGAHRRRRAGLEADGSARSDGGAGGVG